MTRVTPVLPSDLIKASTYDLLTYLNTKLAEQVEENDFSYNDKLSEVTTELLMRQGKKHDN